MVTLVLKMRTRSFTVYTCVQKYGAVLGFLPISTGSSIFCYASLKPVCLVRHFFEQCISTYGNSCVGIISTKLLFLNNQFIIEDKKTNVNNVILYRN